MLWKFRWYSLLNQLLIWTTIALVFGALLERFQRGGGRPGRRQHAPAEQSGQPTPAEEPVPTA